MKIEGENKYWKKDKIKSDDKETWARIRCRNVCRDGKKSRSQWECRICQKGSATLMHISRCKDIHDKLNEEGKQAKNKWIEEINRELSNDTIIEVLKREIKKDLCVLRREVERMFKERAIYNKNYQCAADI